MELFDQGKQPKIVHVPVILGNGGLAEMRNDSDDVPGVAGQGARKEAARVVNEMEDDHF